MRGQDLGFLGAMIGALGALLVGLSGLRRRSIPVAVALLLLLTLPLGLFAVALPTAIGIPEDYLGLPLTLLYGAAWMVLGWSWIRRRDASSGSISSAASR